MRSSYPFLARRIRSVAEHGFTLLEILSVILIIIILAALLVPQVLTFRKRAAGAACVGNLHSLDTAIRKYALDHDGWFPYARDSLLGNAGEWRMQLCPYLDIRTPTTPEEQKNVFQKSPFWCPATKREKDDTVQTSYGMSAFFYLVQSKYHISPYSSPTSGDFPGSGCAIKPFSGSDVLDSTGQKIGPSRILVLTDQSSLKTNHGYTHFSIRGAYDWLDQDSNATSAFDRHNGRKNVLFLDGHVQACKPDDIDPDLLFYNPPK